EVAVRAQRATAALAMEEGEDVRRHGLARDAFGVRLAERLLDQRFDVVERVVRRAAEEEAGASELPVRVRDPSGLVRRLDACRGARAAASGVEERQLVRL